MRRRLLLGLPAAARAVLGTRAGLLDRHWIEIRLPRLRPATERR